MRSSHRNRGTCSRTWIVAAMLPLIAIIGCQNTQAPVACTATTIADRPFAASADETFRKGPYIMHTTVNSSVVMWETADSCDGTVLYGKLPAELNLQAVHPGAASVHEVTLEGLVPDSRYYYQARSCGRTSAVHHLYTAPPAGTPVRFTIWGDSQSHPEISSRIVKAMAARHPYFTLHVGDVVGDGSIESQWQDELFTPLRPLGHHVPTYIAMGNHERNSHFFYRYVSYPNAGTEVGESNYAFTYGNVFVLIFNAQHIYFPIAGTETPLSSWIREQASSAAAQRATWRIAAAHQPGYSESWSPGGCANYDGTEAIRNWLLPLLAENDFHAYLSGHTHAYERAQVDGMTQLISGGAGGGLDEWCRDLAVTEVVRLEHHYVLAEAGCQELTFSAYALSADEAPFDTYTIKADRR